MMRCLHCNNEIPDDSIFCPECGQKQNKPQGSATCANCGMPLEAGAAFCAECGTPCSPEPASPPAPQSRPEFIPNDFPPDPPESPRRRGWIIAIVIVALVAVLALASTGAYFYLTKYKDTNKKDDPSTENTQAEDNDEKEDDDEIDLSQVDFNLLEEDHLYLEGMIKKTESGSRVLRWEKELTFYGEDLDGAKLLLEEARTAYIDEASLPEGMLDTVKSNETVSIDGQLYFDNEKLYITPDKITDEEGNDLIAAFNEAKQESDAIAEYDAANDYILPQSASRLLDMNDISHLSLREINYAKNEIYARHGRLFDSPELQNYFNSKSWYYGSISADAFNSSVLSSIEQKNAAFLADVEFSIDPKGYQLDSN